MYNIIADLHTHSIASAHAYSTIKEMCATAHEKGLYALAITDHAKLMPGAPQEVGYFANMPPSLPRNYEGVLFIPGVEGNVCDFEGNMDIPERDYKALDWVVASIHDLPNIEGLRNPDIDKCTQMWTNIAKNPHINIIGHCGDPRFEFDYEKVIPIFAENHKLIEINSHSFDVREQNIPNCRRIAEICMKHGIELVVSSDAHSDAQIADHKMALKMLEEINFPEELILNASVDRLNAYFEKHTTVFTRTRFE